MRNECITRPNNLIKKITLPNTLIFRLGFIMSETKQDFFYKITKDFSSNVNPL